MTFEIRFLLCTAPVITVAVVIVMLLKKRPPNQCIGAALALFAAFWLIGECFPLRFGPATTGMSKAYNNFIPFVNLWHAMNTYTLGDGGVETRYTVAMQSLIGFFIADLAASVLFGAVAFLRRRNAVSSALEGWAICAGLIIVSAAAFLCGISMGRYFDTAELLIAGAGAFIGAFCMKQVCGSAKKEEPVNE